MKFLIDAALSPVVARLLAAAGHDAVHVYEYEMHASPDSQILRRAEEEGRVLVSADTDFGTLLALSGAAAPSVVLFRGGLDRNPRRLVDLLLASLPSISFPLDEGAIVILEPSRTRIRRLPIESA